MKEGMSWSESLIMYIHTGTLYKQSFDNIRLCSFPKYQMWFPFREIQNRLCEDTVCPYLLLACDLNHESCNLHANQLLV